MQIVSSNLGIEEAVVATEAARLFGFQNTSSRFREVISGQLVRLCRAGLSDSCKVVYSGDMVKLDEDGFLYFVGREDNQIKSAGFRVSPTEVEEVLCKCADLREAAVIGIPDPVLGQRICAFVVAAEGSHVDAQDLLASCAAAMPRHMIPKSVEVVASLPKTSSGKIDYPALPKHTHPEPIA
jgi:acyl-coenzyme A synthetase/AMP-(fatty) acid ligase